MANNFVVSHHQFNYLKDGKNTKDGRKTWQLKTSKAQYMAKEIYYFLAQRQQFCINVYAKLQ